LPYIKPDFLKLDAADGLAKKTALFIGPDTSRQS
jgi:hypothetical protein